MYDLWIAPDAVPSHDEDVTVLLYEPRTNVTQVLFHAVLNDILLP